MKQKVKATKARKTRAIDEKVELGSGNVFVEPAFRLLSGPFIRNPKSPGSQRGSSHFSKGTKARKDLYACHDLVEVFWQTTLGT